MEVNLRELGKDIQEMEIISEEARKEICNKFYELMRKYNLKEGEAEYNSEGEMIGRTVNNYEWTMCIDYFIMKAVRELELPLILFAETPEDLKC